MLRSSSRTLRKCIVSNQIPITSRTYSSAFVTYLYNSKTFNKTCSSQLSTRNQRCYYSTEASTEAPSDPTENWTKEDFDAQRIQDRFFRLGLNSNICKQITITHPHIQKPTTAQSALIPAILAPNDIILRAHTGTGKSFGILLALLSKPRLLFRNAKKTVDESKSKLRASAGIASIIMVPTNDLAFQYMDWARRLFPTTIIPSLDPVIQCVTRGQYIDESGELLCHSRETIVKEENNLIKNSPHILIGTPTRLFDIYKTERGRSLLGIDTLRTLVLDEADHMLQLPGRFPTLKTTWAHETHTPDGLQFLNEILRDRVTYSSGEPHITAGLENRPGRKRDDKNPPSEIRTRAYRAVEMRKKKITFSQPPTRYPGIEPLQLICISATANSVMRHFFGARTGWLRPGARNEEDSSGRQLARWIDLTGLSGKSLVEQGFNKLFGTRQKEKVISDQLTQSSIENEDVLIPKSIKHMCVVVEEPLLSKQVTRLPLRNLNIKLSRKKRENEVLEEKLIQDDPNFEPIEWTPENFTVTENPEKLKDFEIDQGLLEALAFCIASEIVERGLVIIPNLWSSQKTISKMLDLGIKVRSLRDLRRGSDKSPHVYVLPCTFSRGIDIPGITHVFLLGTSSVQTSVQYIHSAGRVSRLDNRKLERKDGKVITLVRGLPHNITKPNPDPFNPEENLISQSEFKMGMIYKRLGIWIKPFDLSLLNKVSSKDTNTDNVSAKDTVQPTQTIEDYGIEIEGDMSDRIVAVPSKEEDSKVTESNKSSFRFD